MTERAKVFWNLAIRMPWAVLMVIQAWKHSKTRQSLFQHTANKYKYSREINILSDNWQPTVNQNLASKNAIILYQCFQVYISIKWQFESLDKLSHSTSNSVLSSNFYRCCKKISTTSSGNCSNVDLPSMLFTSSRIWILTGILSICCSSLCKSWRDWCTLSNLVTSRLMALAVEGIFSDMVSFKRNQLSFGKRTCDGLPHC